MKRNVFTAGRWRCSRLSVAATAPVAAAQQKITDERTAGTDSRRRGTRRRVAAGARARRAAVRPGVTGQRDTRPAMQLTLDDAIKLALDRNLDIAVQRLNPQTFDYSLASLRAIYKPTLTSTVAQQSATNPSTQTTLGRRRSGTGIDRRHNDLQRRPRRRTSAGAAARSR